MLSDIVLSQHFDSISPASFAEIVLRCDSGCLFLLFVVVCIFVLLLRNLKDVSCVLFDALHRVVTVIFLRRFLAVRHGP